MGSKFWRVPLSRAWAGMFTPTSCDKRPSSRDKLVRAFRADWLEVETGDGINRWWYWSPASSASGTVVRSDICFMDRDADGERGPLQRDGDPRRRISLGLLSKTRHHRAMKKLLPVPSRLI